ncbi:hypothetical protein IJT17_01905 [bacterium]|nr:hypothetical protein [bacterium]
MKKFIVGVLAGACLLTCAGMAEASDLELFVRNRPFEGVVVNQAGGMNASLGDLLQSLGYSWSVSGRTINIIKEKFADDAEVPPLSGRYTLTMDGVGLPVTVKDINGVTCVNVEAFAKAAGLHYKANHALGCADLTAPVDKSKIVDTTVAKAKPAAKKAPGQPVTTDGFDGKSPLRVIDMPYSDTSVPGQRYEGLVRTSAVITNTGDKDITNVNMTLDICNYDGQSYYSWQQHAAVIKAGETYNFNPDPPVWHNYSLIVLQPKMKIVHDPIPEDEEEEEAAK